MSAYLILDVAIFALPLAFSFGRRVAFWRRWPSVIASTLVVEITMVLWRALSLHRGDFVFSPGSTLSTPVFGLPLDDVLFFVASAYATIFLYEVVRAFVPEKGVTMTPWKAVALGTAFLVAGLVLYRFPYMLTVLVLCGAYFLIAAAIAPHLLASSWYWIAFGIAYVVMLIAQGIIGGLSAITFDAADVLGIHVAFVPLETFFFCIIPVGLALLAHILLRSRLSIDPS